MERSGVRTKLTKGRDVSKTAETNMNRDSEGRYMDNDINMIEEEKHRQNTRIGQLAQ